MRTFPQLSYHERVKIYTGICQKKSVRKIAESIDRPPSTVSREIKRNSDKYGYLSAGQAHEAAMRRKHINPPKIDSRSDLRAYIEEKIRLRWSPDVIAGSWNLTHPEQSICKETIYQWLYSSDDSLKLELRKLLVRKRKKRGFRAAKKKKSTIKNRVSIDKRPEHINNRSKLGHFECDLVFNEGSASKNICTMIERVTRKCIMIHNGDKSTKTVMDAIIEFITTEKLMVKSMTFDNGTEFAGHTRLNEIGITTYFCDPGKPYQKGAIENCNGQIRRYLPFDQKADDVTDEYVKQINIMMNDMPRKILGYKTPSQVFEALCKKHDPSSESRVKLAKPAIEAIPVNEKYSRVAFHC